ncbi:MAG TPA: DUF3817 domain-containing protein [Acidimicrobiales bacterium]|nr:DUF3817 domain-containing protein [Acidimicrobiales bacterium]
MTSPPRLTSAALLRYRVMAYLIGVFLLVLCLIGVPLQYGAGQPGVVEVVGPLHGILYIIYLVVAMDLARRSRWTLGQVVAVVVAGFLPFLAFWVEHRVTRRLQGELTAQEPDRPLRPASPPG